MDRIYALMRAYGITAEQAAEVVARQDREVNAKALASGGAVPKRIPLEQVPLVGYTKETQPGPDTYDPYEWDKQQWQLVRADVPDDRTKPIREQWERPGPHGNDVRIWDRPQDVSRKAIQDSETGEWITPRTAYVRKPRG